MKIGFFPFIFTKESQWPKSFLFSPKYPAIKKLFFFKVKKKVKISLRGYAWIINRCPINWPVNKNSAKGLPFVLCKFDTCPRKMGIIANRSVHRPIGYGLRNTNREKR
jgi:hypothetical protein